MHPMFCARRSALLTVVWTDRVVWCALWGAWPSWRDFAAKRTMCSLPATCWEGFLALSGLVKHKASAWGASTRVAQGRCSQALTAL